MASNTVGALVSDALDACGLALSNLGGSIAGKLISEIFKKRIEAAREIALGEMRRGERFQSYVAHGDEIAAVVMKYLECARQGAARRNLRLMARIMRGQMATRSLYADEFLRFADILASLNREEVCFLGTAYRARRKILGRDRNWPAHELRRNVDHEIEESIGGRGKPFANRRIWRCRLRSLRSRHVGAGQDQDRQGWENPDVHHD
jgi:hypothetical protein